MAATIARKRQQTRRRGEEVAQLTDAPSLPGQPTTTTSDGPPAAAARAGARECLAAPRRSRGVMSCLSKLSLTCAAAALLMAGGQAAANVTVKDVKIQLLSQVDHKVFDPDRVPDDHGYPYGMDLEVMVSVRLSSKGNSDKAVKLALSAIAPGYESEATGKVEAVTQKATRQVYPSGDGDRWYHFVFDAVCDTLTVTAKAGNSKKTVKAQLVCAE
jgi:hypothetical protein